MYFLYGSLIALQGGSSATDVRQLDAAEVNPVWKTNQSPNIPKFNPASLAPGADLENVLTHIHNPGNRIGDICRYLTQRGWAPPGKKWKMPVKERLEAVLNSIYRTEGSWLPIGGLATDGTGEVVHGRLIKDRFLLSGIGFTQRRWNLYRATGCLRTLLEFFCHFRQYRMATCFAVVSGRGCCNTGNCFGRGSSGSLCRR